MACSYKSKRKNKLGESLLKQYIIEARKSLLEHPFDSMEPPADYSPSFVDTTKVVRKPEGTENIPPSFPKKFVDRIVTNYYKELKKNHNRINRVVEVYNQIKESNHKYKDEEDKDKKKGKSEVKVSPTIKEKEVM